MNQMSAQLLYGLIGAAISILSDVVPGFKTWFAGLEPNKRRLVMVVFLLFASLGIIFLSCWSVSAHFIANYITLPCTEAGFLAVLEAFFFALLGNQSTFLIKPKKKKPPF